MSLSGFGAFWGSLYAPDHKRHEAVAGEQSRNGDYQGPSQSLRDIAGLPGPIERAIANPSPETGSDNERRDLAAQEASALWAFWMVVASVASVLVTTIGTVFLYKQIVLTREAVEDTGEATRTMKDANEIAKDANRPWLELEEIDGVDFERGEGQSLHSVSFVARVTNHGNAPAVFTAIHAHFLRAWGYFPKKEVQNLFGSSRSSFGFGKTVYPRQAKILGERLKHGVGLQQATTTTERRDHSVESHLLVIGVTYGSPTTGREYYTARIYRFTAGEFPHTGWVPVFDDGAEHHGECRANDGNGH